MADVTVATGAFDDGAAKFAQAMDRTLRTWAFEVERRAKLKSPVDTGFNLNSIYVVTPSGEMQTNGKTISQRPGDPNAPSTKGRKKYRPGQFAQQTPISAGGYQQTLKSIGRQSIANVTVMGGIQLIGPGVQDAPDEFSSETRVGSEYGPYLEMGTIYREATPFLGPAAAEVTPRLDRLMRSNLAKVGL